MSPKFKADACRSIDEGTRRYESCGASRANARGIKASKDVQSRGDGRMLKYIKWKRIERRMEKKKEEHGMEGMCEAHKNGEG